MPVCVAQAGYVSVGGWCALSLVAYAVCAIIMAMRMHSFLYNNACILLDPVMVWVSLSGPDFVSYRPALLSPPSSPLPLVCNLPHMAICWSLLQLHRSNAKEGLVAGFSLSILPVLLCLKPPRAARGTLGCLTQEEGELKSGHMKIRLTS